MKSIVCVLPLALGVLLLSACSPTAAELKAQTQAEVDEDIAKLHQECLLARQQREAADIRRQEYYTAIFSEYAALH